MIQILQLLLSLSILVVLHELGHYLAAKFFGCRVEKFYLFMDWPYALFKKKIGETEFGIGCAPLGGYVKIAGFVDESMDSEGFESEPESWELRAKPAWQRLIIMLGGIFVNLILAWVIYSMIAFSWGEKYTPMSSLVDGFSFSPSAKKLGFVDGDQILSIDGEVLAEYDPMLMSVILFEGAENIKVLRGGVEKNIEIQESVVNKIIKGIERGSGPFMSPNVRWLVGGFVDGAPSKKSGVEVGDRILSIDSLPTLFYQPQAVFEYLSLRKNTNVSLKVNRGFNTFFIDVPVGDDGKIGIFPSNGEYEKLRTYSFFNSFSAGLDKTSRMIKMYVGQIKTMFNPSTGAYKHMGGFISIGQMFPSDWNWLVFWSMTALLSIILAIMNLLPIPALDGGHALIAVIEMVSGKKIPLKVLMPLQVAGMVLLLGLVLYANGMDVWRLFN
ncbi:RIP metalloprotease RseP [Flavobacteriales bacterium]|nr:RIP metalloprotease RseP [Flavobacteriales bacterium]